jgi:hypothetical protein
MQTIARKVGRKSSIKRIVKLGLTPEGGYRPVEVLEPDRKRRGKKVKKGLRPITKMLRRYAKSQRRLADEYLDRHERSSRKKKNGAARDFFKNWRVAQRKGLKEL